MWTELGWCYERKSRKQLINVRNIIEINGKNTGNTNKLWTAKEERKWLNSIKKQNTWVIATARQLPSTTADGDSIHLSVRHRTGGRVRTLIYNPPPSVRPSASPPTRIPSLSLRHQHDGVAMATMTTAEANVSSNRSFFVWLCQVHICRRCHAKSLTVTCQVLLSRYI